MSEWMYQSGIAVMCRLKQFQINAAAVLNALGKMTTLLRIYLISTALLEIYNIGVVLREGATLTAPILRELVGGGRNAEERKGIDALW